jgi:hypothetical protein
MKQLFGVLLLYCFASPAYGQDTNCTSISVGQGNMYVDDCGRQRFFRGLNAVVKGWPWMPDTLTFSSNFSLNIDDAGAYTV